MSEKVIAIEVPLDCEIDDKGAEHKGPLYHWTEDPSDLAAGGEHVLCQAHLIALAGEDAVEAAKPVGPHERKIVRKPCPEYPEPPPGVARKTAEEWAAHRGHVNQPRPGQPGYKPGAFDPSQDRAFHYLMARAHNGWALGQMMTCAEYDAAVSAAGSVKGA